ncbi:MAG: arsenate reductase (azurin) large subunit [Gammaproteobacteria bacterium]|nr:arsenate reductase (azurin) large subunit [Gammaproteobacteria bacterium]
MSRINDRIPLPPASAQTTNLTCHFCIVGCGYKVHKWPEHQEGGRAPQDNALGLDFTRQLAPLQACLSPGMVNTIQDNDGSRHHIMIVPDKECVVNQGQASTRGGMLGHLMYNGKGPSASRLTQPLLYRGANWRESPWEQALALYAGLTKKILDEDGPDEIYFNLFDHGGAGGGYENTWGTGKLIFTGLQTQKVRIHNRPAYNSECHATRDMGINELNNSYEDAEVADVLWSIGNNPYETQTNYFLVHWIPNLQGGTVSKKQQWFPGETVGRGRAIFVDPRRTTSIAIAEQAAGTENVLHLAINPGTDTALFNGLLTYVAEQGWLDSEFIAQRTNGYEQALSANRLSLEDCSELTGVPVAQLIQAAEWSYKPKASGHMPRTMHAYEKGIIWGNDNYRIQSALVNLVLATGNVGGRRGAGVVRMGGHQEGYVRPPFPGGRPAPYVDGEIIAGRGKILTTWACDAFRSTHNAQNYRAAVIRRANIVREAIDQARGASTAELIDIIYDAVTTKGGLFVVSIDIYPKPFGEAGHMMLPATVPGEMNLTSMNGERRMRLSEKFMDAPGSAKPDCLIAAAIANALKALYEQDGNSTMAARFAGFDWRSEEDAFMDGFNNNDSELVTYERLRALGNNGVQLPVTGLENGLLVGTEVTYTERFDSEDGRAKFQPSPWNGLLPEAQQQKDKYPFWVNNGRVNELWQTLYNDEHVEFRTSRWPMTLVEIGSEDAQRLGINSGDVVELFNDYGATQGMAHVEPTIKPGQVFMQAMGRNGVMGDLATTAVDQNILPYYKGTWADVRRIGDMGLSRTVTSKRRHFV